MIRKCARAVPSTWKAYYVVPKSSRLVAERVAPFDLMMALVPGGFALGLAGARGELLEVMPGFRAPPMQVSLVYPNRRQRSRRLTGFIEWFEALVRPLLDL